MKSGLVGFRRRSWSAQNQKGISIVQAILIIGVVSAIGASIATMMVNTNKQARSVSAKTDFNSLVNTIQASLNNTSGCLKALGGAGAVTLAAFPVTLNLDIGATPIAVGQYGSTLKISKLELTSKTAATGANQWTVPLSLVADRSTGTESAVGGNILVHTFDLLVTVDGTNKITACSAVTSNFWVTTDTATDIAYVGGNVGVWGKPAVKKNAQGRLPGISVGALLDVNGTTGDKAKDGLFTGTVFKYASDYRLKENIREIPSALAKILKLHGTMFDWKTGVSSGQSRSQLGFIAQEVEKIFPEAVLTSPQTGLKSVAYEGLIAPFIEAFKQRQNLILKQQKEIDEIKKELFKK